MSEDHAYRRIHFVAQQVEEDRHRIEYHHGSKAHTSIAESASFSDGDARMPSISFWGRATVRF